MHFHLYHLIFRTTLTCYVIALSSACTNTIPSSAEQTKVQTENITIADKYNLQRLTSETIGMAIDDCLPEANIDIDTHTNHFNEQLRKIRTGQSVVVSTRNDKSNSVFIYEGDVGACITTSGAGYPILPAEAIVKTINPKGVDIEIETKWNRSIVLAIARNGSAKVAYNFSNGSAVVAEYRVDDDKNDVALYYSSKYYREGEWSPNDVDHVFSNPDLTATTTVKHNNRSKKFPRFRHLYDSDNPAVIKPPPSISV